MEFTIRSVEMEDIPIISALYQNSVLHAEKKVYNQEKLITWASVVEDAGFFDFVTQPMSLVAIEKNTIIGFGSIKNDGHIILLYKDAWKKRRNSGMIY